MMNMSLTGSLSVAPSYSRIACATSVFTLPFSGLQPLEDPFGSE
jgi:hypothetical protein